MPSLSLIEVEARRLIGSLPETQRRPLQAALVELCESHWQELRGPTPTTSLARVLWSVTPLCADLLIDLYASGDARLALTSCLDRIWQKAWRCWCWRKSNAATKRACISPMNP